MQFYGVKLGKFFAEVESETAQRQDVERFLLKFNNPGNRHAYYRAIKTYYRWREEEYGLSNPIVHLKAPRLPKLMLPSLSKEEVLSLIGRAGNIRDKAILQFLSKADFGYRNWRISVTTI
jgi:site-specific recombinase XerD